MLSVRLCDFVDIVMLRYPENIFILVIGWDVGVGKN